METTESYDYEDEDDVDYAEPDNGAIFSCPTANCMAEFLRYDRLQKHIIAGQCKLKKEVETTELKALLALDILRKLEKMTPSKIWLLT